jgi:hypothetical protein
MNQELHEIAYWRKETENWIARCKSHNDLILKIEEVVLRPGELERGGIGANLLTRIMELEQAWRSKESAIRLAEIRTYEKLALERCLEKALREAEMIKAHQTFLPTGWEEEARQLLKVG